MTSLNDFAALTPESCPVCRASAFECFEQYRLSGSRGAGLDWLVRCRGCGGLWRAVALIHEVLAGVPLDWFVVDSDQRTAPRPEPRRPPTPRCPGCGDELRVENECTGCGWLKHPTTSRDGWGRAGRCPGCGFEYRWDGAACSHCGHSNSTGGE